MKNPTVWPLFFLNPETDPLKYLNSLGRHTVKPGLERISSIMSAAGNPHLLQNSVLIAGTNGKTSVAAMLAKILSGAGLRTGLYTSPHLIRVNERISVDGTPITDAELAGAINEARQVSLLVGVQPSYFEILTAAAFIFFKEKKTDFAVLETGMGGRWDATNISRPLGTAITNVSLDHTRYLGGTVEEIAAEKAGIAKPGIPLVTAAEGGALGVIEKICSEKNAPVSVNGRDFRCRKTGNGEFSYGGLKWKIHGIRPAAKGIFRAENIAVALACAESLEAAGGFNITPDGAKEAVESAFVSARMEYLRHSPPLILDGAHNAAAAERLARSIRESHGEEKFVFVVAMSDDKDHRGFVENIAPVCSRLIFTGAGGEKFVDPEKLLKLAPPQIRAEAVTPPLLAMEKALQTSLPCCLTGSLYFAGEVKKLIHEHSVSIHTQKPAHRRNP